MKFRKITAFILSVLLTVSFVPVCSFASTVGEETAYTEMSSYALYSDSSKSTVSVEGLSDFADIDILKAYILEKIKAVPDIIDISSFNIPHSLSSAVSDLIWYNMPEAFNVGTISFTHNYNTLISICLKYRDFADTADEYADCLAEFIAAASVLLDGVKGNDALGDAEKALLLHDRLAINTQYDYSGTGNIKHTAYGAFCKKAAVCQGYTMAYMYLLNEVGIENYYCSSKSMNHAWNILYIKGKAYHTDVAWDDVSWSGKGRGIVGRVKHDNFLRSTAGFIKTGHTGGDFDTTPTDTAYDNYCWQNSVTEFCLVGNSLYYIDNENSKLMKYGSKEALSDVSSVWKAGGNSYYTDNFACLSYSDGILYYSLSDKIYSYNVHNGKTEEVFAPGLDSGYSIFGFTYSDGKIICDINNTLSNTVNLSQISKNICEHSLSESAAAKYLISSADCVSGAKYYKSCSVCGKKSEKIFIYGTADSSHHADTEIIPAVSSTCTETGVTEGVYCNGCEQYVSGHAVTEINPANHVNTVKTKAVEATVFNVGYTEGIYCNDCKKYISGHKEIKKIIGLSASPTAKDDGEYIVMAEGVTVAELLSLSSVSTVIKTADGKILKSDECPGTGSLLILPDGREETIVVLGDVDGDSAVSSSDARLALRRSVGLENYKENSPCYKAACVLGNEKLSAADARLILRASVNLENPENWMK